MNLVPTRGATEPAQSWTRAPAAAFALRAVAHALPVVVAWLAVRITARLYWRPDGWIGLVAWLAQAVVVSGAVSVAVDKVSRRLLPLAALLNLSLAFPDHAPSRFGLALRAGSTRSLQDRLTEIHRNGLGHDVQEALGNALELVTAVSRHDRRTRGHTERVRAYADLIARELGLTESERLHLAWGVLLHDVGKLTVPPEVLNKETPLTPEEWDVLRQHPAAGAAIVAPLAPWLGDWVRAAEDHHERWDGRGYPNGRAGADISLAGRITAVADAYDVITSARSYKAPMSAVAARHELVRCSGTQFDPEVVRAFLSASFGRRWNGGPLAWLMELPSLGRLTTAMANSAATVTAAGATLVASVTGLAAVDYQPHHELAMVAGEVGGGAAAPAEATTTSGRANVAVIDTATTTTAPPAADSTTPATTAALAPEPASSSTTPATTARSATTARPATTVGASSSTAPASSSTTAPPATTTTAAGAGGPYAAYLTNPGIGPTFWSGSILPLSSFAPTAGSLPNYDLDRDSQPGLGLTASTGSLSSPSFRSYEDWYSSPLTLTRTLSGTATVTLYLTDSRLEGDRTVGVRVGLYACPPFGSCSLLANGQWKGEGGGVNVFATATVPLGTVRHTLTAGSTIRVRVMASQALADQDLALAYDTAAYPAAVRIS